MFTRCCGCSKHRIILGSYDALQKCVAKSKVPRPSDQLDHRVLIDGKSIRIKRNHVSLRRRSVMQIVCIDEIHGARGSAANCTCVGRDLERQRVRALALISTVEHHVRAHILERLETGLSQLRGRALSGDALDALEGLEVVPIHVVIGHDQVRGVAPTDQLHPEGVHVRQDVRRARRRAAVSQGGVGDVAEEWPLAAIDAANGSGSRGRGDKQLQAANGIGSRAVAVNAHAQAVQERAFAVLDAGFEQVNNSLFTQSCYRKGFLSLTSNGFVPVSSAYIIASILAPGARGWVIVSSPPMRYTFFRPRAFALHRKLGSGLAFQRSPSSPGLRTPSVLRVLDLLQSANGNSQSGLADRKFSSSKDLARVDIKSLI